MVPLSLRIRPMDLSMRQGQNEWSLVRWEGDFANRRCEAAGCWAWDQLPKLPFKNE